MKELANQLMDFATPSLVLLLYMRTMYPVWFGITVGIGIGLFAGWCVRHASAYIREELYYFTHDY